MLIRDMCWFRFFVVNSLDFVNSIILSCYTSWKLGRNYAGNLTNFGCEYIWPALWVLNDDCLFYLADKNTRLVLLLMPVITHAPGTSMTLMSGFTCGSLTPRTSKVLRSPLYVTWYLSDSIDSSLAEHWQRSGQWSNEQLSLFFEVQGSPGSLCVGGQAGAGASPGCKLLHPCWSCTVVWWRWV